MSNRRAFLSSCTSSRTPWPVGHAGRVPSSTRRRLPDVRRRVLLRTQRLHVTVGYPELQQSNARSQTMPMPSACGSGARRRRVSPSPGNSTRPRPRSCGRLCARSLQRDRQDLADVVGEVERHDFTHRLGDVIEIRPLRAADHVGQTRPVSGQHFRFTPRSAAPCPGA